MIELWRRGSPIWYEGGFIARLDAKASESRTFDEFPLGADHEFALSSRVDVLPEAALDIEVTSRRCRLSATHVVDIPVAKLSAVGVMQPLLTGAPGSTNVAVFSRFRIELDRNPAAWRTIEKLLPEDMAMFMRQLRYLIELDKHRHFGRAAESCHVSQPALSAGISELERELGITIIKRDRSFRGLTPEGERVIVWARRMLESLEGLRQEAELVRSIPGGHLSIGVVPSAVHPVTLLSTEYRQLMAGLTLNIQSLSTQEVLQRLKEQDLHLGLAYDDAVTDDAYDILPLFTERYVLVAGEQASLPRELSWRDLADMPLCLLSQDMQNRRMLEQIFMQNGVKPDVVIESNAIRVLVAEALSGRAFSIMPLSALPTAYAGGGLRIHTIIPEHRADVSLVRLKREQQPPVSEAAWRLAANIDLQEKLDRPLAEIAR